VSAVDVLLREVKRDGSGAIRYQDVEVSVPAVTIGSRNDRVLQLLGPRVGAEHATLVAGRGGAEVRCERGRTVRVDGRDVRRAKLAPGSLVELDGHRLRLVEAPAGFDLALEYEIDEKAQAAGFERAFVTDLDRTWLGRRGPAWTLLLAVVVVTLAVPLALQFTGDEAPGGAAPARAAWVPDDRLWTSGPLHPAHQLALGDDCGACHQALFQRVPDDSCTSCHADLADHVPAELATRIDAAPGRCASCHLEHNEPERLVLEGDGLCTDCHAEPERFAPHVELASTTGFGDARHPAFAVDLVQPVVQEAGTGLLFSWETVRMPLDAAEDRSNLVFPHDVHLDAGKVRTLDTDAALACGDCHRAQPDGEHFAPVRMAEHCIDCHELKFDPDDPSRELPHGQPLEVLLTIEGHYLRKFSDPDRGADDGRRRRRPDRGADAARCTDSPFACAMAATEQEAINQFTQRGCVTCHRVEDLGTADLYGRFQVRPVRLTADFYADARFDHRSHRTHPELEGDAVCGDCHDARSSSASADVLMPALDGCTDCHGDASVGDVVVLACGDCHGYHPHGTTTAATGLRSAAVIPLPRLQEAGP
jgi:predicted CXXCH cytochrome family protein